MGSSTSLALSEVGLPASAAGFVLFEYRRLAVGEIGPPSRRGLEEGQTGRDTLVARATCASREELRDVT